MKLHIVTVGQPKLAYAQAGWKEYLHRLQRFHQVRTTHIADKHADASHMIAATAGSYRVALDLAGKQFTSLGLARFLEIRAGEGREVSFIIGGPTGLPKELLETADYRWSFSELTFPHDLAMVILLEALYRASTISAGYPYHK